MYTVDQLVPNPNFRQLTARSDYTEHACAHPPTVPAVKSLTVFDMVVMSLNKVSLGGAEFVCFFAIHAQIFKRVSSEFQR